MDHEIPATNHWDESGNADRHFRTRHTVNAFIAVVVCLAQVDVVPVDASTTTQKGGFFPSLFVALVVVASKIGHQSSRWDRTRTNIVLPQTHPLDQSNEKSAKAGGLRVIVILIPSFTLVDLLSPIWLLLLGWILFCFEFKGVKKCSAWLYLSESQVVFT